MKRLQIGLSLAGFSFFAILLLRYVRVPFMDPSGSASSIAAFVVMGLVFLFFIKRFNLPSLEYFGLPRISPGSIFAMALSAAILISVVSNEDNVMKPWKVAVPGIIFLLSIGFGEEIVARGFIYGVLQRRSHKAAIFVSSLFFAKPRKIWAPRWLKGIAIRLAINWKLVDESSDKPALVGQN